MKQKESEKKMASAFFEQQKNLGKTTKDAIKASENIIIEGFLTIEPNDIENRFVRAAMRIKPQEYHFKLRFKYE